ncbi:unnamed protein product [Discula destructiva]
MKLPFHGVHVRGDILFAARGGAIHSFNTDGSHISCWKYPVEEAKSQNNGQHSTPVATQDNDDDDSGPPAKRVKVENEGEAESKPARSDAGSTDGQKKGRGKKQQHGHSNLAQPPEHPMVIIMASTHGENASHLVAVTSDKSIWVFEHDGRGGLKQLSRRTMPKRPCSIVLTPDNRDILSADKFGDVYSLPLLPSEDPSTTTTQPPATTTEAPLPPASPSPAPASPATSTTTSTAAVGTTDPALGPFVPQATELTVHTARNRKALTNQLISRTNPKAWGGTPKRVAESFERHLLLGHVSLLTAIALGHHHDDHASGHRRPYIITADRDEHIRVSRGTRAQAHVVEQYCMGHEQFVNRLLVAGELLLSGGGDGEVFVWRWLEGALVAKADVLGMVREVVEGTEKIALTGLSRWPGGGGGGGGGGENDDNEGMRIVVICERVPAIFLYRLKDSGALEYSSTINLPGNPFEVGVQDNNKLIVAFDPSNKQAGEFDVKKSLLRVEHVGGEYQVSEDVVKDVASVAAEVSSSDDVTPEEFEKMLYSAETLRKIYLEERVPADEINDDADTKDEETEAKDEPMVV